LSHEHIAWLILEENDMRRLALAVCVFIASTVSVYAAVQGEDVEYTADGTALKGYLAYDDAISGTRPGILVVHEWWGHNEYARRRAEMLAELGYAALAVDMYGEGKQAAHPDDAGKFATALRKNIPLAKARFLAAMEFLKQQPATDPDRIAAIGYCLGGGIVLEMARAGMELDGVASFHGSLGTSQPAKSGVVKAKVLVFNGADDPFVKPEQIARFKAEMNTAGVDYDFINYPGAKHSFTNPQADAFGKKFGMPLAYDRDADEKSWARMQLFFESIFSD
jgi:dienelactone hydrolase